MELKILSYNVQQTPARAVRALADGLVDNLNKPEFQYDVVCLQEVFWNPHRRVISRGLRRGGYTNQVKKFGQEIPDWLFFIGWFRQDSGLFIASRLPINRGRRRDRFEKFEIPGREFDFVAQKGVSCTEVKVGEKKLFAFNTHLQSGGQHADLRKAQLDQIKEAIPRKIFRFIDLENDLKKNEAGDEYIANFSVLFMGDLNIDPKTRAEEYQYLTQEIFKEGSDIYRKHKPNDLGHTKAGTPPRRLDYIFDLDSISVPDDSGLPDGINRIKLNPVEVVDAEVVKMQTDTGRDVSDHFGVGITIKI